jgi:hypothetical protein
VLEEQLAALRTATSVSVARKTVFELEDQYTPPQLRELLPQLGALTGNAAEACRTSFILQELHMKPAENYRREDLGPDVVFYRGEGDRDQKSLIVTFCGRSQRPNMARSLFLQYLPSHLFDVAILCDRANNHYNDGIAGYASDMLSLQRRLVTDLQPDAYRRFYCYGTSSGGLPAIRVGLLAGADRSIAVGGVFAWPIYRLTQGQSFQAFDPICACYAEHRGRVVLIHASNERDLIGARQAEKILKAKRIRVTTTADHNTNHQLYLAGKLMDFHGRMFEFGSGPYF